MAATSDIAWPCRRCARGVKTPETRIPVGVSPRSIASATGSGSRQVYSPPQLAARANCSSHSSTVLAKSAEASTDHSRSTGRASLEAMPKRPGDSRTLFTAQAPEMARRLGFAADTGETAPVLSERARLVIDALHCRHLDSIRRQTVGEHSKGLLRHPRQRQAVRGLEHRCTHDHCVVFRDRPELPAASLAVANHVAGRAQEYAVQRLVGDQETHRGPEECGRLGERVNLHRRTLARHGVVGASSGPC